MRPPRTLRPTRAGWIFFFLVFAVGFAALNTGNNLLYLVLSLMLGFLTLSGLLSEAALRGIAVERRLPRELVARRPARVVLEVANRQPRVTAHAIRVEDLPRRADGRPGAPLGRVVLLRIGPGETLRRSYRFEPRERGPFALAGFRVTTRFPFALFAKSLWIESPATALVYPHLARCLPPASAPQTRPLGARHQGGANLDAEVSGLRDFRRGDTARRIHWQASWRRGELLVREAEGEAGRETHLTLRTAGVAADDRFEAEVERTASRAEAGLRAGLRVGLRTDTGAIAAGDGAAHRARLLRTLALVHPTPPERDEAVG